MLRQCMTEAVNAIPVPPCLEADILAACRRAALAPAPKPAVRYIPAAATAAACVAVLGVTLLSSGQLPGQLPTQPESHTPSAGLVVSGNPTGTTKAPTLPTQDTTSPAQNTTLPSPATTSPPATTTAPVSAPTQSADISGSNALCQLAIIGRFEEMTEEQLAAYFGRRVLPTRLPEGLERRNMDNSTQGIYHRDEVMMARHPEQWAYLLGQGTVRDEAVVYDLNSFMWVDWVNGERELTVSISSAPYPRHRLGDLTRFDVTRQVAGVTVKVAHYDDSPYSGQWCYSALATVDGVEYYVSAWNFTEAEFLDTVASLLEE